MAGYDIKQYLIVYEYNEKEHKQFVKDWFEGFSGAVHSDADSFFGDLYAQTNVEPLLCNTHARSKFEAITNATKKKGLAHHAMSVYAKIYQIERKMKAEKRTFDEIKTIRQEKSVPLLINFKQWLEENQSLVPQKSPIAKAINYTLRHWDGLARFCEDGLADR